MSKEPFKDSHLQDLILREAYKQRTHSWQAITAGQFTSAITLQQLLTTCYDLKSRGYLKTVTKDGEKILVRISVAGKARGEQMGR